MFGSKKLVTSLRAPLIMIYTAVREKCAVRVSKMLFIKLHLF